jgi:diguanylate cyclase (GGDEF)-like protein
VSRPRLPRQPPSADPEPEVEALRQEVQSLRARLAAAEAMADADGLTPVLNRRAFVRELTRAIAYLSRYGGCACLLYFDLDGFKRVNDRWGHAAGDVALTAAASRLLANVRASDLVGRLGGDEFAVILARTDGRAGAAKAQALAAAVCADPVIVGEASIGLKVSWGLCELGAESAAEPALAEADARMYLRKGASEG